MGRHVNAKKMEQAVTVYKNSFGNVSITCEKIGVSRKTFYEWLKKYPDFKDKIEEVDELNIDLAETALLRNIRDGKEASIFFFLKCKAKHRGYIEKSEMDVNARFSLLDVMMEASQTEE